jgi:hypothetical protein
MSSDRDTTRIVRSWLEEGVTSLPARVLDVVLDQLPTTRQRRLSWPARRFPYMNTFAKIAAAAAAVVLVAMIGTRLLPSSGGLGGPAVSPSPSPSPSVSPPAEVWPTGDIEVGRHEATLAEVSFSFRVQTSGWDSRRYTGMIEKGTYPTPDYVWIGFSAGGAARTRVYADPCAGVQGPPIGPSAADFASALTTIPGTDAIGPTDVTVGGLPAKLVELTIHPDIGCGPREFFLYGDEGESGGIYLNALESVIRVWIVDVNGARFVIHSDQTAPSDEIAQEVQQIIDSIRFE